MIVQSFDNANWPIIAAMAWIRRRKRCDVDAVLSTLQDTDLISLEFDASWDDCESKNSTPNHRIVLESQLEFWRAVQVNQPSTRLKLTGLLNDGHRQEIPSSDTPDMQLTERDFKYVIINADQCGGGVWRDILCARDEVFKIWPENASKVLQESISVQSSPRKGGRPFRERELAINAISKIYSDGVPKHLSNDKLAELVNQEIETTHGKTVSKDTILRAAGLRKT